MATETLQPDCLLFSLRDAATPHRDTLGAALDRLAPMPHDAAIELIACAGEDERAYRLVTDAALLDALCRAADEFLADDDGGYHEMALHVARRTAAPAVLELWFQVRSPWSSGNGAWFRHLVVRIGPDRVLANLGPAAE